MMLWVALAVVVILIAQDILLVYFFHARFKRHDEGLQWKEQLPTVSVIIPARNEIQVLPTCLAALSRLDYPSEKLQLLVADDQSIDGTGPMLEAWASEGANREKVKIEAKYTHLNGKANALAQMAQKASGELLLFTDADCEVNPMWVKAMVKAYTPKVGLVVGLTSVRRRGLFGRLQGQDWWLTLGMIKVTSDVGHLLTAVGNNMLISQEAYRRVGGFEGLPFSVTEDFVMGEAIKAAGFRPI